MNRFQSLLMRGLVAAVAAGIFYSAAAEAAAERIKDLATIAGVRENQLVGYGLVVGLQGTGDSLNNSPFTKQSLQAMLERLGIVSEFRGGLRVTTPEVRDVVRMVLTGQVQRELVGLINADLPYAVGLSGEDGPF